MLSNSTKGRRARLNSEQGFTLIELLVVIAIIAILAAILFPVFAKVREKARQTACLSNMNQIAKGLEVYKQDFDGFFPPSQLPMGCLAAGATLYSWPTLMYPYISSQDVFVCPSTSAAVREQVIGFNPGASKYYGVTTDGSPFGTAMTGDGSTADVGLVHQLSYGRNLIPDANNTTANKRTWIDPTWGNNNNAPTDPGCSAATGLPPATNLRKSGFVLHGTTASVNESDVEAPATTIHIVDAVATSNLNGNSIRGLQTEFRTDHYLSMDSSTINPATANKPSSRHNDGFNAIYGDGHVKWNHFGSTKPQDWTIQDD